MKPRVLVGCEFSGRVRDAFFAKGWDAWSCDLLPSETPGNHWQGDIRDVLKQPWDLLVGFPPCTYLCNSGVRWLKDNPQRWKAMKEGAEFFKMLWKCDIPRIAIENPIMHGHAKKIVGADQSQVIQPYNFGEPFQKATCLWLKNLPPLINTVTVQERKQSCWLEGPNPDRAKNRSRTYQGIANAMAEQWSRYILE